jgi:hypothetical protein
MRSLVDGSTNQSGQLWGRVPEPWRGRLSLLGEMASKRGMPAAIVGGCVRDLVLNLSPKDWDVVVEGPVAPLVREVSAALSARLVEHPRFRTFTLHFADGTHLDVATARTETYPKPGALPVVSGSTLREDSRRRDFTSNALYLPLLPNAGDILDPTGGQEDMKAGVLRVLHDQSFVDDPTRLYRAARYAARYGWAVEAQTQALVQKAVNEDRPRSVSRVRLRHELFHLLEEEKPASALRLTWDWGLWKFWDETWVFVEERSQKVLTLPQESPPVQRLALFFRIRSLTFLVDFSSEKIEFDLFYDENLSMTPLIPVLSGMRPTGKLHLGNYWGALVPWINLQNGGKHQCYFMVADLHALTTGYEDTKDLQQNIYDMVLDWLAAGLDPEKSVLFVQSRVPEHSELSLIFSMITPLGWLERIPTYKEQLREITGREITTHGFLGYPVLQAADILLYKAQAVPVGEDQLSHLGADPRNCSAF